MCEYKRCQYIPYRTDELKPEDFTAEQKRFLADLNAKLFDIEKGIKQQAMPLLKEIERRVNDPDDWLEDYEFDCYITFTLKEDDPGFREDEDNVLVQLWEGLKSEDWKWGLADGNNHNDQEGWDHSLIKDEHHCWLYHALYDHTDLDWINMLRIGHIQVDFEVAYQKFYDI